MSDKNTPFFVGYLPVPGPLRRFLLVASGLVVGLFIAAGVLLGSAQDAPPESGFRFDYGRQTVTGVIELTPYPVLRVTQGNELIKPGKTLMLTNAGKSGADRRAKDLDGKLATVSGIVLQRGTIDMLQLRGGAQGLKPAEGTAPEMTVKQLGRWKIAGEICDGKCLSGAMRPGRGLAHKACANLCLILWYLSRFWFLELWARGGLFGWSELRPGGGLLGRWLRGTPLAPFELLIWACGVFLVLTYLQRLIDYVFPAKAPREDTAPGP